jgi:hypothetical protein
MCHVSRLVYAAHLRRVDEAYRASRGARLRPAGTADDIMRPDRYRTHLLFQVSMPELRNDTRFPRLCARLGLVELRLATDKWADCADEVAYDFRTGCLKIKNVEKDKFAV